MDKVKTPITGNSQEGLEVDSSIYQALNQFYKAFNHRDISMMQDNWLIDENIIMANPLGGIKSGWNEINEVYKRIFSEKVKVYVEFYDYNIFKFDGGFCAIGRERGYVKIDANKLDLAIRTSRVYRLVNGKYKQIHHHGSIENPQLLKEYQNLV